MSVTTHDYGTDCKDCERYRKLGDVCVIEHGKKFLWEFCRDFVPLVKLPDYNELMRTVRQEQALERQKTREKKQRERKKKLKETLEQKEQKKKERRARLRRIRLRKKKKLEEKTLEAAKKRKKELTAEPEANENSKISNLPGSQQ